MALLHIVVTDFKHVEYCFAFVKSNANQWMTVMDFLKASGAMESQGGQYIFIHIIQFNNPIINNSIIKPLDSHGFLNECLETSNVLVTWTFN